MADDPQQQSGQQQPPTGDATGQQGGSNAGGAGNGGTGDDKRFTQAELDAIVKDRLDRERKASETKAQREREAAEADALKEQSKFKELADQREKQLADLEPFKDKAERYEAALKTHLDAERKSLPAHITALLDKLDVAEQLEWIASNREAIAKQAGNDGKASRGTATDLKANGKAPTQDDLIEEHAKRLQATGLFGRL